MIWGSIVLKTYAFVMGRDHLLWGAVLWGLSLLLDTRVFLRQASAGGGRLRVPLEVTLLNFAALVAAWTTGVCCDYAAMRWKEGLPILGSLAAWALQGVGLPVGVRSGEVFLTTMSGPLKFSVSLDLLAVWVPAWVVTLSGVYLMAWGCSWWSLGTRLGWVVFSLAAVSLARFVVAVGLFLALCDFVGYESEELPLGPFVRWPTLTWSFLPFLLAMAPLAGRWFQSEKKVSAAAMGLGGRWLVAGGVGVAGFLVLGLWPSDGHLKQGKVLINTFHTQWSRTDRAYDREWYGADSGYNYACLKRWFEGFYEVEELRGRVREEDLEEASVLIVYIPDRPFSADEIRAIVTFVREGGGLFLIGDHTNVFGSTSHLNDLASQFGFFFRDDVLFDLDEDFFQLFEVPGRPSPFLHGMQFFKFRGPASVQPTSLFTRSVIELGHAKSVRAIYSVNNFYPPPHDHPQMMVGRFCVSAASRFGSGRVVSFADSTVFSNFEIFYPGKYEYLLNVVHWLNHRDTHLGIYARRCSLVLAFLGGVYLLSRVGRPKQALWVLTGALVAVQAALLVTRWAEFRSWEFPHPVRPFDAVFFRAEAEDPRYLLTAFTTDSPYDERYDVFIQWILRTGAIVGFEVEGGAARGTSLLDHLRERSLGQCARGLIVQEERQLSQVVELGRESADSRHPMVILFSRKLSWSSVHEALREGNLVPEGATLRDPPASWPSGESVLDRGGQGVLLVFSAERFSDQSMGFSEKVVPSVEQRALFEQVFGLIDRLFGKEQVSGP